MTPSLLAPAIGVPYEGGNAPNIAALALPLPSLALAIDKQQHHHRR
jgi:hypothetical protein